MAIPRFFVSIPLRNLASIDFDASDSGRVVAIRAQGGAFQVESTFFDFSIGIVDPHRANNRICQEVETKDRVDGFIKNILRPGVRFREVDEPEYEAIFARLMEKSAHMARNKRRKQILETNGQIARAGQLTRADKPSEME